MKRMILLAAILVVLCGCVHYDEELWLNRDGSGKAKIVVIHRSNYENSEDILHKDDIKGIHLQDYSIKRNGPHVIYSIRFRFDNIEAFNNVNDQVENNDFWGRITLNKVKGSRRIIYKRSISLGDQKDDEDLLESIIRQQTTEYPKWSYRLHLPWKVISTNGAFVDQNKHILSWTYDTQKLWNRTEVMTVEMRKGFPWLIVVLGLVILSLLVVLLSWLLKIARRSHLLDWKRHQKEQVSPPSDS